MKCNAHTKAVLDDSWISVSTTTLHQHKLYYCKIALICHIVNRTYCAIRLPNHQHFTERRSASGNRQNLKNKNRGAVLNNRALKLKATDTVQLPFRYCFSLYADVQLVKRDIVTAVIYCYITTDFHYAKCDSRLSAYGGVMLQRVYSSSSKSIKSPASGSSDLIYNNWKSNKTTHKIYSYIMLKKTN